MPTGAVLLLIELTFIGLFVVGTGGYLVALLIGLAQKPKPGRWLRKIQSLFTQRSP